MRARLKILLIMSAAFLLCIGTSLSQFSPDISGRAHFAEAATSTIPLEEGRGRGPAFPLTIVIDPGHGGTDKGAIGPSGLSESHAALVIAKKLGSIIAERLGSRVILTRSDDYSAPIDERASMANFYKADMFLSLHLAASPNSAARGTNVLVHGYGDPQGGRVGLGSTPKEDYPGASLKNPSPKVSRRPWDTVQESYQAPSELLAKTFQDNFIRSAIDPEAAMAKLPLSVLKGLSMPAVMIEVAYITNPEQEAKLQKDNYLDELGEILYISLRDFLKKSLIQ